MCYIDPRSSPETTSAGSVQNKDDDHTEIYPSSWLEFAACWELEVDTVVLLFGPNYIISVKL